MADLAKIKDKTLDNVVAQLKAWATGGDDIALKAFISQNTDLQSLSKVDLKRRFKDFIADEDQVDSSSDELRAMMEEHERIMYVMFGTPSAELAESIPENVRGKAMTHQRALAYLEGWNLGAEAGQPTCELVVWTSQRVIWNKVIEGSPSELMKIPTTPPKEFPELP